MNLLIVDDHPTNLKLLRRTLQTLGHTVVEAADGVEALRALDREPVQGIISDILMPNMDGYRLCFEIRKNPRFQALPIVIYSSTYLTPSDRDLALSFGANVFLEKPATAEKLAATLQEVMTQPAPAATGESEEDLGVLKKYSERLITKIEEKNVQLVRRTVELEASEEKFRQLAESIREVFWIVNPDATETHYISPAFEQIWGRPCQELYDRPRLWMDSLHPDDRDSVEASLSRLGSSRDSVEFEYRILRPDHTVRWIRARGFPVRETTGQIYRIAGIAEDVTDRKALEQQLVQSQKMEGIGRLAGGIAHDFNNLLTAILGYSQMVMGQLEENDPIRADVEEVSKAGQRAAELTRQLLAFSRKQLLEPRVLDPNEVIRGLERMLRRLLGEDIQITLTLRTDIGRVRADPGQLEQVLVNLSVNARDAMPKGGRLVFETSEVDLDGSPTATRAALEPGRYVLLSVSDTGTGMDAQVLAHLFEPFFTTKESGKGTGLGLATVYGIIKQSGGEVEVASQLGKGTTFRLYLPRVEAAAEGPKSFVPPSLRKGTETILLVEDESGVRNLMRTILRKNGYTVLEATSGAEAIALLQGRSGEIHLLLTDVVMPGLSGRQTADAIQGLHPEAKVLYVSGYTEDAIVHHGMLDRGIEVLHKPFTPQSLLMRVREVLDARRT